MDTNENTTPGRASYTEEERRELIEEFQSSNLTQAAFCREWNLNSKTLARWLRIERGDNEVSFCEVDLDGKALQTDEVLIRLPNQVEVVVPEKLGSLLREASEC